MLHMFSFKIQGKQLTSKTMAKIDTRLTKTYVGKDIKKKKDIKKIGSDFRIDT